MLTVGVWFLWVVSGAAWQPVADYTTLVACEQARGAYDRAQCLTEIEQP